MECCSSSWVILRRLGGWLGWAGLILPTALSAATITVNSSGDPEAFNPAVTIGTLGTTVTLRDAINAANNTPGDDVIEFAPALAGQTIRVARVGDTTFGPTAFKIPAGSGITLRGPSGNGGGITIARDRTTTFDYIGAFGTPIYTPEIVLRLFHVEAGGSLGLVQMTLAEGSAKGAGYDNYAEQALTVGQGVYPGGAGAGLGGAILNAGTLTLDRSLLQGNTAQGGSGRSFVAWTPNPALFGGAELGPDQGVGGGASSNIGGILSTDGLGALGDLIYVNAVRASNWGRPLEFLGRGLGGNRIFWDPEGNRGYRPMPGIGQHGTFGWGGRSDAITHLGVEYYEIVVWFIPLRFSFFNPGTGPGEVGGFGGGGGGSRSVGGNGGFGGGGGSAPNQGGLGGFGGGNGSATASGDGAGFGGAIFNYGGTVRATNSTFSGNVASGASGLGGAIFNLNGATELVHCTLSHNRANQGGGAIYSLGDNGIATQDGPALPSTTATVALWNSLLGNTQGDAADFIQNARASDGIRSGAVFSSGSGNIVARTPDGPMGFGGAFMSEGGYLDALADNGGPTRTMMPFAGGPAIGGGVTGLGVTVDQRGVSRVNPFSPGTPTPPTIGSVDQAKPSALRPRLVRSRSDPDFNLVAAAGLWPRGGTFFGSGLSAPGTFSPGAASLGTNHLTYLVTDAFARSSSTTLEVVVEPGDPTLAETRLDPDAEFERSLHDVGIPLGQLTRVTPVNGTFHHPAVQRGVLLPSIAGVGLHRVSYYHPGNDSEEPRFTSFQIRVRDVAPTQPQLVRGLVDNGHLSFQVSVDTGTVDAGQNARNFYGGAGFDGFGRYFTPSVVGIGSAAYGASFWADFPFVRGYETWYVSVLPYPPLYVPPAARDSDLLLDDAPVRLATYATIQPAGGVYSGPGVGPGGVFTPSAAGLGSHTLTYTIAEGATARQTTTFVIRVVEPDPTITIPVRRFERIVTDPAIDLAALTSASPTGGTFSGPGVVGGVFTPSSADLGLHRLRYTLPGGASAGFSITVNDVPFAVADDLNLASQELNCSISDPQVDLMALLPPRGPGRPVCRTWNRQQPVPARDHGRGSAHGHLPAERHPDAEGDVQPGDGQRHRSRAGGLRAFPGPVPVPHLRPAEEPAGLDRRAADRRHLLRSRGGWRPVQSGRRRGGNPHDPLHRVGDPAAV
jgi:hypothetical protein